MEYIKARNIVTNNKPNSWFGYEYNMNIYRGCNHGCIYCDSRCSCYREADFDTVKAKENALQIIRDDVRRKTKKGVICSGSMSDPYNSYERELKLTRNALELINAFEFGVGLITKSDLVTRDIDILKDISEHSPVIVKVTITAADDNLSKIVEPNAPPSSVRFEAVKRLAEAGIFVGVLLMPVLPFIEDTEENMLCLTDQAARCGAKFVFPRAGVTLRGNQKEYFYEQLDLRFEGLSSKYEEQYGNKVYCNSPNTRRLMKSFREYCKKHNILYNMEDIIRMSRHGYQSYWNQIPL